jgi:4-hydroxyphenylpyruvate dioxygenase-like putative hemolysin
MADLPERATEAAAVSHAVASAMHAGVELDDAWQATLRAVASGARHASDVVAEEIRKLSSPS